MSPDVVQCPWGGVGEELVCNGIKAKDNVFGIVGRSVMPVDIRAKLEAPH